MTQAGVLSGPRPPPSTPFTDRAVWGQATGPGRQVWLMRPGDRRLGETTQTKRGLQLGQAGPQQVGPGEGGSGEDQPGPSKGPVATPRIRR